LRAQPLVNRVLKPPRRWIVEGENVSFYGPPYPTRSVITRLQGRLFVLTE